MSEIKPVAWAIEYAPGKYAVTDSRTKTDEDVPLVYIPPTHRIVSVELLEKTVFGLAAHATTTKAQLRTIIDNKDCT